ncbi:BspA family leucine-rich repeat surface protein [Mycoplasma capricolum subsp. capricolum]|uniref:BspA family leucine-rich repeat surface protein n=1 Tax=Mycoplasma capricolum TaxID=2095 RepID=UPI003DA6A18A
MKKLLTILTTSSAVFLITAGVMIANKNSGVNSKVNYNSKVRETNHTTNGDRLTGIGYYLWNGHVRIKQIPPRVRVIAAELPEEITSLRAAFVGTIDNIIWEKSWNTKNITDMNSMFYGRKNFNSSELEKWDTSNVTDMGEMFYGVTDFNQDLSKWDTSNVKTFEKMFENAENFNNNNKPLNWGEKLKSANNMKRMFKGAKNFNQDISDWNVTNVKTFEQMFEGAASFNNNNKPLNWGEKLKSANNMKRMFKDTSNFKHDLSGWLMKTVVNNEDFGLDPNKQPQWKIGASPSDIPLTIVPKVDNSSNIEPPIISVDPIDSEKAPEKPEQPKISNETIERNENIKENNNPKNNNYKIPSAKLNLTKPSSANAGVITGAVLGSFTILGITAGFGYYYRKNLKNLYLKSADKLKPSLLKSKDNIKGFYFKSKNKIKNKIAKIRSKK